MAGVGAILAGSAYVRLYADQNEYVRGLRVAEQKLHAFGNAVGNIGKRMMALSAAAAAPIALSTRVFAAFQDEMLTVQAVTGATTQEFNRLYEQAKKLGAETALSSSQAAAGQVSLARQGFSPAEIEAAIPSVVALTLATGTDLARAADIAAGTLRAFSLDASEMGRVTDVLVATANNSAQTIEDLGDSMKYAAPIAAEYGLSIEQTAKALGVLANMQIKGSMAGTSLRNIMLALANPAVQEQLNSIGVAAVDADGKLRPLGDIMIEIGQAMAGMSEAARLGLAADLFGDRAVGAALKLANSDFPALSAAIDNAAGVAQQAADTMESGLGGAFRELSSAIEAVQIAIGEGLVGILGAWAEQLTAASRSAGEWISEHQELLMTAAKIVVWMGGAGAAFVATGAAVKAMATAAGAAAAALRLLASPIAAATTATHGLNAAMTGLAANPVAAVIAGLAAIGVVLYRSETAYRSMAGSMNEVRKSADEMRAEDRRLMQELQTLSEKQGLTNDEMDRAESIIERLQGRYGDLGLSVDRAAESINGLGGAIEQMNERMRRARLSQLRVELDQLNAEILAIEEERGSSVRQISEGLFGTGYDEVLLNKIRALFAQRDVLTLEIEKLEGGDTSDEAIAGEAGKAPAPPVDYDPKKPAMTAEEIEGRIRRLRIEAIEDDRQRAIAAINAQYDEEEKRAEGLTDVLEKLAEARQIALENVEADFDRRQQEEAGREERRRRDAQLSLEDQIARQKIENIWAAQLPGDDANAAELDIQRRKALLEQERKEALRDAEAIGLDPEQVNKLFDMRLARIDIDAASAARAATRSPTGSFSAQAAVLSGLGGKTEDKAVKATKEVKRTIEDGNETLADIRDEVKRGGGMAP